MDPAPQPPLPGESFYARTFALLVLFALAFLLYKILWPFFAPLAWALFLAFLLHPLHVWLVARLRGRANLSALLLTLGTFLILIGPLAAMGAAFVAQVADLLRIAHQLTAGDGLARLPDLTAVPVLGAVIEWLQETWGISLAQVQVWLLEAARKVLEFLTSLGGRIFLGALNTALSFALTLFMLFFMVRDGAQMVATAGALIPMSADYKARLFGHLAAVTRAMVYGSGATALVQGVLVGVAFAIVGLPSPIVFAVLAALFALVPMVGPTVIWVPAVVALFMQQRWFAGIFLFAWGALVVALIDNVLYPLLVSARARVGTLTVFIGVLGGVAAFGTIGALLGPLVLALVIALLRFALELREAEAAASKDQGASGER